MAKKSATGYDPCVAPSTSVKLGPTNSLRAENADPMDESRALSEYKRLCLDVLPLDHSDLGLREDHARSPGTAAILRFMSSDPSVGATSATVRRWITNQLRQAVIDNTGENEEEFKRETYKLKKQGWLSSPKMGADRRVGYFLYSFMDETERLPTSDTGDLVGKRALLIHPIPQDWEHQVRSFSVDAVNQVWAVIRGAAAEQDHISLPALLEEPADISELMKSFQQSVIQAVERGDLDTKHTIKQLNAGFKELENAIKRRDASGFQRAATALGPFISAAAAANTPQGFDAVLRIAKSFFDQ